MEWTFLNHSHPGEKQDVRTRWKIRSSVSRRQHYLKRKDAAKRPRAHEPSGSSNLRHDNHQTYAIASRKPLDRSTLSIHTCACRDQACISRKYSCSQLQPDEKINFSRCLARVRKDQEATTKLRSETVAKSVSITPLPLNNAPVTREPWFGWLHDLWFKKTLPNAKHLLRMSSSQLDVYISWIWQVQHSDPAMYYMSLLIATGIPVANGHFPLERALWLRGCAVAAVNEALDDPERATSDAIIQAVGFIALHEHIYGDRAAAHQIHRPAQRRMIELRGGVDKLGLPYELKQIMVWYDTLMASEAGNDLFLGDFIDGRHVIRYNKEEATAVTNNASPHRNKHPGYGIPKGT